jgi:hypothetical protein
MPSRMDDLLASRGTTYWANSGILTLNCILIVAQVSSYATGYDGSMMNGESVESYLSFFSPTENVLKESVWV